MQSGSTPAVEAFNAPLVLTCGEHAGGGSGDTLCSVFPADPLIDVRIAAWVLDPTCPEVRSCANVCGASCRSVGFAV